MLRKNKGWNQGITEQDYSQPPVGDINTERYLEKLRKSDKIIYDTQYLPWCKGYGFIPLDFEEWWGCRNPQIHGALLKQQNEAVRLAEGKSVLGKAEVTSPDALAMGVEGSYDVNKHIEQTRDRVYYNDLPMPELCKDCGRGEILVYHTMTEQPGYRVHCLICNSKYEVFAEEAKEK